MTTLRNPALVATTSRMRLIWEFDVDTPAG
jgi:hypothetical protein